MVNDNPQQTKRPQEEVERLRVLRERYQQEKPSITDLEAQGAEFATLGEVTLLRCIADELRKEREHQGISREQLANRLGLPPETLTNLEAGKVGKNLTLGVLSRIAHALGKRITYSLVENAA